MSKKQASKVIDNAIARNNGQFIALEDIFPGELISERLLRSSRHWTHTVDAKRLSKCQVKMCLHWLETQMHNMAVGQQLIMI